MIINEGPVFFKSFRNTHIGADLRHRSTPTTLMLRIIGLLLSLVTIGLPAQAEVQFKHLSRQDGISQSFVTSIVQDADGFMWFGTQSGLNRFDGYEVKVFEMSDEPNSLRDSSIRSLLVDTNGRLWVATDNGGVAIYVKETETFRAFDSTNSRLPIDRIRLIFQSKQGDIFVGTDGAGFWRYDEQLEDFRNFFGDQAGPDHPMSRASVFSVVEMSSGSTLIGTRSGLYEISEDGQVMPAFSDKPLGEIFSNQHIRSILEASNGEVWVGTEGDGLYRVDVAGSYSHYQAGVQEEFPILGEQVFKVLEDDRGDIWVSTSGGLNRFRDNTILGYANNSQQAQGLRGSIVTNLYQDTGGVLWVATYGGVSYWSRSEYLAEHVYASGDDTNGLSANAVTSFAETSDGSLWVGTFDGGLNRIQADGRIEYVGLDAAGSDPFGGSVMSLFTDSKDNLWVGTRSKGLYQYDPQIGVLRSFSRESAEPNQLSSNAITSISESRFGQILVGTYGGGFNQIDLETYFVTSTEAGAQQGTLPSNRILAVHEDNDGGIWLGTDGAGVVHYDRYRDEYTQFDKSSGLNSDTVSSITENSRGDLWFGSDDNGVFLLRAEFSSLGDYQFQRFSTEDGLASNTAYAIALDSMNRLWISSNAGVSQLDVENQQVHRLGLENGLQDLEFNSGAVLELDNGDILFGGVNGFNRIKPLDFEVNTHPPKTVITGVSKQGETLIVGGLPASGVTLDYQDYFLEITFAGLDYSDSLNNRYRYRLLGLEESWVSAGKRRYASYTNLEAGSYVFEVQAANSDGVWSLESTKLKVVVKPAPWFSVWAYFLYAVCLSLLVAFGYRTVRLRRGHVAEVQSINEQLRREIEVRKETEAQIRMERTKSQRYIDVAEVLLVSLDVEGTVLNVNEKANSLLATGTSSLIGRGILDFIGVAHRNDMRQKMLAVFDQVDTGEHFECQLTALDGSVHSVIWRFAPLTEIDGHINLVLASGTDITELRQLEKTVRFKEKLSALGTLSAGIAHDFNNILTAITGYNDLALEQVSVTSEVKGFLLRVEQASKRATDLVARILSVTQLDEGRLKPLDLTAVIRESVGLLHGSLPAGIQIEESYEPTSVMVDADVAQIHQLVMNLGTNAFKAMEKDGGKLKVEVQQRMLSQSDLPAGSSLSAGLHAVLEFKDTGLGMPEAMKQKIFDPFYSSTGLGFDQRSGAGLGLSIVHGIVLAHKGHIEVDSHLGMGTFFKLYFPLSQSKPSATVVRLPVQQATKKRIMLVDDEEWIVDVTSRLLATLGHEVDAFLHPREALERFKSGATDYEVVITDQNMPQMKGTELIAELRHIRPDIKVILMSGNVSPLEEDDLSYFMAKPFRLDDLKLAMATHGLQGSSLENEDSHST